MSFLWSVLKVRPFRSIFMRNDMMIFNKTNIFINTKDVLTARLLERGKTSGRNDDNIDTILKRFRTFKTESMPIVEMYEKKGLSKTIVADRSVEDVYNEVKSIISNL